MSLFCSKLTTNGAINQSRIEINFPEHKFHRREFISQISPIEAVIRLRHWRLRKKNFQSIYCPSNSAKLSFFRRPANISQGAMEICGYSFEFQLPFAILTISSWQEKGIATLTPHKSRRKYDIVGEENSEIKRHAADTHPYGERKCLRNSKGGSRKEKWKKAFKCRDATACTNN